MLTKTKKEAREVSEKKEEVQELCAKLEAASELYYNVAYYISALLFAIQKLQKIHYSAQFTTAFFQYILQQMEKQVCTVENEAENEASRTVQRMSKLASELTRAVYKFVCVGLPQRERQAFAIHLISLIYSDQLNQEVLNKIGGQLTQWDKDLMFKGIEVVLGKKGMDFDTTFEFLTKASDGFTKVPESARQLMKYWLDEVKERPESTQLSPENALATLVMATASSPLSLSDLLPEVFDLLIQDECYDEPDRT